MAGSSRASMVEKAIEVVRAAAEILDTKPDWITFFKKVMGTEGIIRAAFPNNKQRARFERTEEYTVIQQMLATLRKTEDDEERPKEVTRVIYIRLPDCVHAALRAEASGFETSVNKLCISKLLQVINDELVPTDKTAMRRGSAAAKRKKRAKRARPRHQAEPEALQE